MNQRKGADVNCNLLENDAYLMCHWVCKENTTNDV